MRHRPDWFVAQPCEEEVKADFEAALSDPRVSVLVTELPSGPAVVGYALVRVVKRDSSTEAHARSTVTSESQNGASVCMTSTITVHGQPEQRTECT
ncbi:hypothetical protein ACFPN0_02585 [Kitasatospora cinereorecta]